jgi:DNA modification methylase
MKDSGGQSLFGDFDFAELSSPGFKEDAVREEIVKPILDALGYAASGKYKIQRSKKLKHPFVKTASGKREITIFPDYLLLVDDKYKWVLDAKAPSEEIITGKNREQVFFYAIHPDIRVRFYALCNGKEFAAFAVDEEKPRVYFHVSEIGKHWAELTALLSPKAFLRRQIKAEQASFEEFDYTAAKPLPEMATKKQGAKRHFGVHAYFTRQPYDLVQAYIKNYTKPGDLVLDPFGGYGVTLLESLMLGRKGIHVDINPLSPFIVKGIIAPANIDAMCDTMEKLEREFRSLRPGTPEELELALKTYPHPRGVSLPRDADVRTIEELFTPKQLAELGLLKHLIQRIRNEDLKNSFLLAFSSTITKINLTYHPSTTRGDNAGDSAAFRYYRYRVAPAPVDLDVFETFRIKVKKLIAAKKEMGGIMTPEIAQGADIRKGTATDLSFVQNESVDYIYTDPPYGANIPYLDLSIMWNEWLGLPVTEEDYKLEAIEGGERRKTKSDYSQLIEASIKEMYRVLKYDRWMSFVFQHKDPAYWHLIVDAAEKAGFEYMGTVTQKVGQTSFKKRQNPFTILHGQLIINFRKVRNPQALIKMQLGYETAQLVMQFIEAVIARKQGATLEEIYNELVVRGMELGFLYNLAKEQPNIAGLLREHFDFNPEKQVYQIRKNTKFKSQIPVQVRIRYYLISYMRQMQRQDKFPTFDNIILNIMPLLRNGTTPKHQTILNVLERVAERVGADRWRLVEDKQLQLNLIDEPPEDAPKKAPRGAVIVEDKRKIKR